MLLDPVMAESTGRWMWWHLLFPLQHHWPSPPWPLCFLPVSGQLPASGDKFHNNTCCRVTATVHRAACWHPPAQDGSCCRISSTRQASSVWRSRGLHSHPPGKLAETCLAKWHLAVFASACRVQQMRWSFLAMVHLLLPAITRACLSLLCAQLSCGGWSLQELMSVILSSPSSSHRTAGSHCDPSRGGRLKQ